MNRPEKFNDDFLFEDEITQTEASNDIQYDEENDKVNEKSNKEYSFDIDQSVGYIYDTQLFQNENSVVTFAFEGEDVAEFFPLGFNNEDLNLKMGEINKIHTLGKENYPYIYIIGLGSYKDFDLDLYTKSMNKFFASINEDINVDLITTSFCEKEILSEILTTSFVDAKYKFKKITDEEFQLNKSKMYLSSDVNLDKAINDCVIIADAKNLAKDFVNLPSNVLIPKVYVEFIENLVSNDENIKIDIKDTSKLLDEKFGLITSVNKGSQYECYIVTLEYRGDESSEEFSTIVGKGLTFDTGGLSIKTGSFMQTMKSDMAGSATALSSLLAVSKLQSKVNLRVILGITENSISASSFKVDDVLISKSGKSVEILNTDAEGRLVLADLITHAQDLKTEEIISIATLTGTNAKYFGSYITPMHVTDYKKSTAFVRSAKESFENVWALPINQFNGIYVNDLKRSKVADVTNLSRKGNDGIVASAFLSLFVDDLDKTNFVHLDIAGTSFVDGSATGVMVKTLVKYFTK